jgi:hypothetical protein
MTTETIRKVQKIRKRNERREVIQQKRTLSIMGLSKDADYNKAIAHLREGYNDGLGARVSKRNTSKEYTPKKAASTPFTVENDETTEAPLTALIGREGDFSFLAENDLMDTAETVTPVISEGEAETAFEGLDTVKEAEVVNA